MMSAEMSAEMSADFLNQGVPPVRLSNERFIESVRAANWPQKISRLTGMYCFPDRCSAERACVLWNKQNDNHFHLDRLAEVEIFPVSSPTTVDSNWYTYARCGADGSLDSASLNWIDSYWAGEPCPAQEPIWETIVDGRFVVCGTGLRLAAYKVVVDYFRKSLAFLEFARLSVSLGSDLGAICAFLIDRGDRYELTYEMDMRDACDTIFLDRLRVQIANGEPVNRADLCVPAGGLDRMPDLRSYFVSIPKSTSPAADAALAPVP
jgi:hypothetical protein